MDLNFNTYLTADREQIGNRYVSIPESAQNVSTDLPDVQPDSYLVWNSAGDALVNDTTIPDNVVTTEANKVAAEDSNLEAASWANEAEDTPVKEYTAAVPSDRSPVVYSAKHWAIKAQDAVIGDVEFRDTEWRVFDDLDNTKKVAFQVSGLTTATTRTITMPDTDVDLGDIAVNKSIAETASFKNKLINGGFDVWQRGTSFVPALAAITYTADRFFAVIEGAQKNVNQVISGILGGSKYGISINGANASSNCYLIHRIEHINTHSLQYKAVTVSCYIVATNAGNVTFNLDTPTAVDNYTATTNLDSRVISLSAGLNRIEYTVSNIGDCTKGLSILIGYGALGSNDNRELFDIQLEEGPIATPFENRPIGVELALCQRYFETKYFSFRCYSLASDVVWLSHYMVPKRVLPTITMTGGSSQNTASGITNVTNTNVIKSSWTVGGATAMTSWQDVLFTIDAEL